VLTNTPRGYIIEPVSDTPVGYPARKELIAMADRAKSGEIFAYGGKLYLKKDHTVYEVNRREQTKHDQYESLYELYFGGGSGAQQGAVTVGAN
jgi:hypothetical protein